MNVIVNKWDGERFEYPNLRCWVCGKPATVVELFGLVCAGCLNEAQQTINQALLEHAHVPR
jgi:hypothetical protein